VVTDQLCSMPSPAPRILLIMPEQWPRALLRAALRESGYDAVGAPGLPGALHFPSTDPDRGPVRLLVIDQDALRGPDAGNELAALIDRHGRPELMLLAKGAPASLPTTARKIGWHRTVRRPASIAELMEAVRAMLPLPPDGRRPLD
jgi:DNA-binding response OmpR family regulator